jgi:UDP-N-acetylmuramoylalanine--D-glutamate ligase
MRPTTSWSDLRGRAVGVWGLGIEGQATIRKLAQLGVDPVLVDDRPPADGVIGGRPVLATDAGGLDALRQCAYVVKTPGKSRYDPAVAELTDGGVTVVGALALWLAGADRDRVVCITGTKGKSTTTAIAAHLLDRLGYCALAGGNIGQPPYDPPLETAHHDFWIIETSSYQATDMTVSPPVTAVTSLSPDHLPWHRGEAETYFRDKLSLCHQPGARLTVADGDNALLRTHEDQLAPTVRWVHAADAPEADWMTPLGLLGTHNRRNALIARACIEALGVAEAADDDALRTAAAGFEHLSSRLTPVATVDGVLFVDDGLSTNVLPTLAAVDSFPGRPIALIVGGSDRGIDYIPLADGLAVRTTPTLVLVTESESAASLHAALASRDLGPAVDVEPAGDLVEATRKGFAWARPGGVVLLSPAAPSFDRFRNYTERADAFIAAARSCAL